MRGFQILMIIVCLLLLSNLFAQHDVLTQVFTIDALLNGLYDGETTIQELAEWGDFGIGTFNALDGEMVAVDGYFYQVTSTGTVQIPSPEIKTPFATMTFFESDSRHDLQPRLDFHTFESVMDSLIPTQNIFYAIRIKGSFCAVQTRSVPKQIPPYRMLSDITASLPVFHLEDVKGLVVGFRCPPFVTGINVPGYHLHFLTEDRKAGGHVLDFVIQEAVLEIDEIRQFFMILPEDETFYQLDLTIDREEELNQVERAIPDE
ncbi:acetolactate decarboxylase [bacterium]|nr:acetolactate decarboxylase [bacterium]